MSTPTIGAIDFKQSKEDDNELEITMRGAPDKIVGVLVNGLPQEALLEVHDAIAAELARRRSKR